MSSEILYSLQSVSKSFPIYGGLFRREIASVRAVTDVSLDIHKGETLALVGESGCGKSTLGKVMLRLLNPSAGTLKFRGDDITDLAGEPLRKIRRHIQMVFQDPYASLNPRMTIEDIIGEPIDIHRLAASKQARRDRIAHLMTRCGLRTDGLRKFPHEFSGGQRQRICIARALAVEPDLLICDEPVSALDVSIQAQILGLLQELQREFGLTYLFISHDLRVVRHISSRVAVMYLGRTVEVGQTAQVFDAPRHPYTRALMDSIPSLKVDLENRKKKQQSVLLGDMPSPIHPPSGCAFHPRCSVARLPHCADALPALLAATDKKTNAAEQHTAACHYPLHT